MRRDAGWALPILLKFFTSHADLYIHTLIREFWFHQPKSRSGVFELGVPLVLTTYLMTIRFWDLVLSTLIRIGWDI